MPEKADKQHERATRMSGKPSSPSENHQRKQAAARLSLLFNGGLVLLKLIVGLWSGSVSVLSEAVHSSTDLIAAGIAFLAVRASDTPPDQDHPYGHGKFESISGLAEALLIVSAAAFIVYEAVEKLRAPGGGQALAVGAGMAVMGLSAVTSFLLSRYLRRIGRLTDSFALEADGRHMQTDVVTSLGVFIGLALMHFTGRAWFDPVTALLVAMFIVRTAYILTQDALHLLLDTRLPAEEEAAIRAVLNREAQVLGYHKLRTRKSGSQRIVDVHIQIEDNSSLMQAHALTEELEDRIREALPDTHVTIHTEPYRAEMRHQQQEHAGSASLPDVSKAQQRSGETIPSPPESSTHSSQ